MANPSAVPVCVPKKIVTFVLPSSTSGSGSLKINGLGSSRVFGFELLDLRQIKMTTHPIRTAIEVVRIITISRFSKMMEATSFPESDMLDGSTFPLMMADIRSNGETFTELEEGCISLNGELLVDPEPPEAVKNDSAKEEANQIPVKGISLLINRRNRRKGIGGRGWFIRLPERWWLVGA